MASALIAALEPFQLVHPCPPDWGPVQQVEQQEQEREDYEVGEVSHDVQVLLILLAPHLPDLHIEKYPGVFKQGGKYKGNTAEKPGLHGREPVSLTDKYRFYFVR